MDNDFIVGCLAVIFGIACIFILGAIIYFPTKVELDTFNKFSKTKATFVEAMFTELRVIPN